MKSIINYILILFVFSSCSNSNTSASTQKSIDTVIVYKHDTVSECLPYASIDGLYSGKISKHQLLQAKGIKLNDTKYKILSFRYFERSIQGDKKISNLGPLFNNELVTIFGGVLAHSTVIFENIRACGPNNDTIILNPIILHLPG